MVSFCSLGMLERATLVSRDVGEILSYDTAIAITLRAKF